MSTARAPNTLYAFPGTDDETADLFARLLRPGGGVRAILVNERGAEQRIVGLLERRGVGVVRLLDQERQGRDDRQMVFVWGAGEMGEAISFHAAPTCMAMARPSSANLSPFATKSVSQLTSTITPRREPVWT